MITPEVAGNIGGWSAYWQALQNSQGGGAPVSTDGNNWLNYLLGGAGLLGTIGLLLSPSYKPPQVPGGSLPELTSIPGWSDYIGALQGIVQGQLPAAFQNLLKTQEAAILSGANAQLQNVADVVGARGILNSGLYGRLSQDVMSNAMAEIIRRNRETLASLYGSALTGLGSAAQAQAEWERARQQAAWQQYQLQQQAAEQAAQKQASDLSGILNIVSSLAPIVLGLI